MIYGSDVKLSPIAFKFGEDRYQDWNAWKKICIPRMQYAASLPIKHLSQTDQNARTCVIVGAGPTLLNFIEELRSLEAKSDYDICAINAVHEFLIKNGIIPRFHIIFESDIEDVTISLGGSPHKDVTYYVSSHCHENVFKQLKDYKCVVWHPAINDDRYLQEIRKIFPDEPMVGGDAGYVTLFRSLAVGCLLGYRKYNLYGVDSSFEESDHIDGYRKSNSEATIKVWGKKKITGEMREFKTNPSLAFQAYRFILLCDGNRDLNIKIYGDSLLRYIHHGKYPEVYVD